MFCCSHHMPLEEVQAKDKKLTCCAVYSTFAITFCVVVCRFVAFLTTRSLAMEAALFEAAQDCILSSVNALLVLRSIRPADKLYPFGYGKIEACAAVFQSIFLLGVGCFLIWETSQSIFSHPHEVVYDRTAILFLSISLILTIGLAVIQTFVAKRTKSLAILADSAHYKSDIALNIGLIFCLIVSFQSAWFDVGMGVCIAVYLLWMAKKVGIPAVHILLDRSLPEITLHAIEGIVASEGGKLKALRTHSLGRGELIVMDLEFGARTSLSDIQHKQHDIRHAIQEHFPRAHIIICVA